MGPTGEILEPLGPLAAETAAESFAEQAEALARGGADILWIETMSSVAETEAAIAGARRTGLPVVTTLSFDTNGRTMMGVTPADLAGLCQRHHLAACGSNCGVGAAEVVASIVNLAAAADPDAVLVAKANCGVPQFVDGVIRFNGTPQLMAEYARLSLDAGARIIGGCCGTTPEHLAHDARGARKPRSVGRSRILRRSNRVSAAFPWARPRNCAASSIGKRAPRPARSGGVRCGAVARARKILERRDGAAARRAAACARQGVRRFGRDRHDDRRRHPLHAGENRRLVAEPCGLSRRVGARRLERPARRDGIRRTRRDDSPQRRAVPVCAARAR